MGWKCFSLIIFKFRSGLSALWKWTSVESSSVSAEHNATPNNSSDFWMDEVECDLLIALRSLDGSDGSLL